MKEGRPKRVAEAMRHEIASLLSQGEIKDPRIGFVSVMEVRMSPDLRHANVYVSLYGDEKAKKASLAGLRSSGGWVRGEVTRRLKLRFAPEIRFFEDKTLDDVFHLENLFREIHSAEEAAPGRPAEEGGERTDERD
jgi:ribosome-binding factor A